MSIKDKKRQLMGQVAAVNALTEKIPRKIPTNSFSSIDNSTNSSDFLLDLLNSLSGYADLTSNIIDLMTTKISEIELEVKSKIKKDLKGLISCSVNPNIPSWMLSTSAGITVKIGDIDFYEIRDSLLFKFYELISSYLLS